MALTRAFKSGNSQAIRIPAEIAYDDTTAELFFPSSVTATCSSSRPRARNLKELAAALRAMPKPSEIERYEPMETRDRGRDYPEAP